MTKIIAVVGTTASGKSDLGVQLAKKYGGEIVSCDSRQVYRGLDLGSGKITAEEMQGVPHHLLDVCETGDFYSLAAYQPQAYAALDDIASRGRLPFLVGGTGLYAQAVLDGYSLSDREPDLSYRDELEQLDTQTLYDMLMRVMPDCTVERQNRNRVMRYLEKIHDGDPGHEPNKPRYDSLRLGVAFDRETLKERIDSRLEKRVESGMIEEVAELLKKGVSPEFLTKLGLEYKYLTWYLTGIIPDKKEMLSLLSRDIKRFAKRQMTWFKRDKSIHWLNMTEDPIEEACGLIDRFLLENPLDF